MVLFGEQIFTNPLTFIGYCISFISLLQYITPNLVAYNNTFLLFNFWKSQVQNGYHWAKIKVEVELCFFWRLWGALYFLAFSSFWRLPAFLGVCASSTFIAT